MRYAALVANGWGDRMSGYEKSPDYGSNPPSWVNWIAAGAVVALGLCAAFLTAPPAAGEPKTVEWVDGDSGRFGSIEFRLADVDAPETGPIGSRNGAKCQAEQIKGRAAKAFVQDLTRTGSVEVRQIGETDPYGRQVVEIIAGGKSVTSSALAAGHLRPWPHKNGKATAPRPDWCS